MYKGANSSRLRKNDIIYTPAIVAKRAIEMCDITPDMKVLDPCFGGGVFYHNLPECKKSFCEIEMGKDFFDETERYDLIIGNPPYSMWDKWLEHTVKLTDKFCYVMGVMNITPVRLNKMYSLGFGITKIDVFAVNYWFGSNYIVILERNKPTIMTVSLPKTIMCDICGKACYRGRKGNSYNECCPRIKK